MEMLETQSITYPRLQLMWLLAGIVAMCVIIFFAVRSSTGRYARRRSTCSTCSFCWSRWCMAKAGRGAMKAFLAWGSSSDRGLQTSEFGKIAMIIALCQGSFSGAARAD